MVAKTNAQYVYDDREFLGGYVTLDRRDHGLAGASGCHILWSMVPCVSGRRVVGLRCRFGWFSRWADEHGETSMLGVELSTKMPYRANGEMSAASHNVRPVALATGVWAR